MHQQVLTLWMVAASNERYAELHHLYARDEAHARTQAQSWLRQHPHLPSHEFRLCPRGFTIYRVTLPGSLVVDAP
ncbi:MAG TPA: hypothetical protein VKR06_12810 [Ktedonosporobacter sp.]|nr:hypothetical protein [Ktedonosporobacter sp.]